MDVVRVMEIWCPAASAVGSGYLIADDLVLTAHHVVDGTGPGGLVKVRQLDRTGRTAWLTAELCWPLTPVDTRRERERDGALVRITDPAWQPPPAEAVRFGRIDGTERLDCQGLGFPDAAKRPGTGRRGSMPIRGHFEPLLDYASELIAVHVDEGIVPRRLTQGSGWGGSSGAALFSGPFLVAVLATDRAIADTAQVLEATPAAVLMAQPGFTEVLRRHNAPTRTYEVAGAANLPARTSPADAIPVERALRGLPWKSPVFTGRENTLAELLHLLEPDGAATGRSVLGVITGLPGVGKTELVVQAAHTALERGWFPGGTLFLDVRGYQQDQAMTAEAALDQMLRMMGVPAEDIPAPEQRSQRFASIMEQYAAAGRRILVVIDSVASGAVAQSLVQAAGCALVTSRHALGSITARRIDLGELSADAAVEMLDGELRVCEPTDTRVTDHHEDAVAITRLCGELPLALHIVAALLTEDTTRPLSSMARDLRTAGTRLDELRFREDTRGERGVRAAFDLSYQQLDAEQAHVLRLLRLNLGPEISTEAVAAMAQLEVRVARQLLEELRNMHLIRAGASYGQHGRWRMHDLIALYVAGIPVPAPELQARFLLLLFHYVLSTHEATLRLGPAATHPADHPFADRTQALAWLDTEYPNLTPYGHVFLKEPAFARTVLADLFLGLWRYFEIRRRTDDWIALTTYALTVARALSDRAREAEALTKLGNAFQQARRFDEAVDACRDAISILRELGDRHGEGIALNNLAAALLEADRHLQALPVAQEAAAIFQQAGDRRRECIALTNLGGALTGTGQHTEGIAAYEQAATIVNEVGDLRLKGATLTNLGYVRHHQGAGPEEFIELHRQARAAMAQAGDRCGEGVALSNLAAAHIHADHFDAAVVTAREAASLLRQANDPHSLGAVLVNLSTALRHLGRAGEATDVLTEAVRAYRSSGDTQAEVDAAIGLGTALQAAGDHVGAITSLRGTAAACRARADQRGEGQALGSLGQALWENRQRQEAVTTLRTAVAVSHAAGDCDGEAKALIFLGTALMWDHLDDAIDVLSAATELYQRSGIAPMAELASDGRRTAEAAKHARAALKAQLAAGRFEDVIADYRAATARHAGHQGLSGALARDLGTSLSRAGRFDQAITLLEEATVAFRQADSPEQEQAAYAELEAARAAQRDAHRAALALEDALRHHTGGDDQRLHAAIEEAVRHLGAHDARFLRLLAAIPDPAVSLEAAAILAVADRATILVRLEELSGLAAERDHLKLRVRISHLYREDTRTARGTLDVLTRMRLVRRDPAHAQRWRLPAAIRPFAARSGAQYAGQDLRNRVQTLLHLYYLATAHVASAPLEAGTLAPSLRGAQAQSLDRLMADYPNLVATVVDAADNDLGAVIALDLTRALTHIMSLGYRIKDSIRLGRIARRAAQRLHDRYAEAVVTRNLGGALLSAGQVDQAIVTLREALALYRASGDEHGAGTTLSTLGSALTHAGQLTEADRALRAAVELHHRRGSEFSEAVALSHLGVLLERVGRHDQAIASFREADRLYRRIGDQRHRAVTLIQLAACLRATGRDEEAAAMDRRAAILARMTGNGPVEAIALGPPAGVNPAEGGSA